MKNDFSPVRGMLDYMPKEASMREIIPNALKYVNDIGYDMGVLLKGLRGIDITIFPHEKLKDTLERYREELYRYSGIEV